MAIHRFERTQVIRADTATCWKFFSSPANLSKITPPDLGFEVITPLPEEIYSGLMIEYRVRPLFNLPTTWVTEITHVRAPYYFCDEQRVGPYSLWHHEHFFAELPDGLLQVRDVIHYALPLSPFSEVIHPFLVAPRLEKIFAFRQEVMCKLFGL